MATSVELSANLYQPNPAGKTKERASKPSDKAAAAQAWANQAKEMAALWEQAQKQAPNPAFQLATDKGKDNQGDDMVYELNKNFFKGLVQQAQLLSPQQYTGTSWKNFIRLMKEAMQVAGGSESAAALGKAIRLLQRGMGGLQLAPRQKEFKNLRHALPAERVKTKEELQAEALKKELGAATGSVAVSEGDIGQLVDASSPGVAAADAGAASVPDAASIDVQA